MKRGTEMIHAPNGIAARAMISAMILSCRPNSMEPLVVYVCIAELGVVRHRRVPLHPDGPAVLRLVLGLDGRSLLVPLGGALRQLEAELGLVAERYPSVRPSVPGLDRV